MFCWKFNSIKEFWKSVKIWRNHRHDMVAFLRHSVVFGIRPVWFMTARILIFSRKLRHPHIIILVVKYCAAISPTAELLFVLVSNVRRHLIQRTVLPRPFCLSVCLSVCETHRLWQNERNLCPNSYTTWKIIYPGFLTKRMVGGGDPFFLKFLAELTLLERKRRFSIDIQS